MQTFQERKRMDLNIQIHKEIHLLQDILPDFEVKQSHIIASSMCTMNTVVFHFGSVNSCYT